MKEEVIAPDRRRRHVTEADLDRAVRDAVATQELRGDMVALGGRFVDHEIQCAKKHEEVKQALLAQDEHRMAAFALLQGRMGRLERVYFMASGVIGVFAFMGTDVGKRLYHILFQ